MVDPVSGSGGASNTGAVNRAQNKNQIENRLEKRAEALGESRGLDSVELSDEAISLAQAEATAAQIRQILEDNVNETLSRDTGQIDKLL